MLHARFLAWILSEQGVEAHAHAVIDAFPGVLRPELDDLVSVLWRGHLGLRSNQLRAKSVERLKEADVEKFNKECRAMRNTFRNKPLASSGLPGVEAIIAELDRRIDNTQDLENRLSRRLSEVSYPSVGRPRDLDTTIALDAWKVLGAEYGQRRCARASVAFIHNIGALGEQGRDVMAEKFYQAIQRFEAEGR